MTIPSGTTLTTYLPQVYQPTAWEWLLEDELFGKPPVPDDWVAPTMYIGSYTRLETRLGTAWPWPRIEGDWGTAPVVVDSLSLSGQTVFDVVYRTVQSSSSPSQPWPRNSKERRVLKALGSEGLFEALCDFAEEDRPLDHDSWNAAFWSFVVRPPVPRRTRCVSTSGSPSVFQSHSAPRHRALGHYPQRGVCG